MRKVLKLFIFLFLLTAATTPNSQSNYATLSGIIYDPQQNVLPGCSVQLISETTGLTLSRQQQQRQLPD